MQGSSNLKLLFSSKLRVKVFSHFFLHPGEKIHIRGLAAILKESPGTLARELANLEKAGVMTFEKIGNQKHYYLHKESPIYEELRRIFLKTTGAGEELRKVLMNVKGIEVAFIYGSFASGEAGEGSDIDLMVVGKVKEKELAPAVARLERKIGREINYTIYTRNESMKRIGLEGDFVHEVFTSSKIVLIGKSDDRLFKAD